MKYHFFLHYGWFVQNLRKEAAAVPTFMHTTVVVALFSPANVCKDDFQKVLLEFFKPPSVQKSSKILKFNKAKEDFLSPKITRKSNPKGRVLYLLFSS